MSLAWRFLRTDARGGALRLLLIALTLAVAATTSLSFFSAGLDLGLRRQAAGLIAADLILSGAEPFPAAVSALARKHDLNMVETTEFSSVLQHQDQFQLTAVKAVSGGYPLRGELLLAQGKGAVPANGIPVPGTLWVEPRLLTQLNAKVGDVIQLGDAQLSIAAVIAREPDQGTNASLFSPRAIINTVDVGPAHVIQPGSRITYHLLFSGAPAALAGFRQEVKPRLSPGDHLFDVASGRTEIGGPLQKASEYLSLASIAAVVLSGVAIALSARRFSEEHYDALALMRCLGASQARLKGIYLQQIGLIWALALVAGSILGLAASRILFGMLSNLLPVSDAAVAWQRPLLIGIATATLTFAGFGLPPLVSLFRVSPLRVLRRELDPPSLSTISVTAAALIALFLLLLLETRQVLLTSWTIAGGLGLIVIIGGGLWLALRGLRRREQGRTSINIWYLGARELWRHPSATITQVLGLTLGLTAMLLVFNLRGELLNSWHAKLPPQTPNQFAMGIPADQMQAFGEVLQQNHLAHASLYPVVRGRLASINGVPIATLVDREKKKSGAEHDEALTRELNLTWADTLPAANKLVAGHWWQPGDTPWQVSLESKMAGRLGVRLGDTLQFSLLEGQFTTKVTSLRTVDWDSFQPNFFMVLPPAALKDYPSTYLTSFYVAPAQRPLLINLVRQFPTVVLVDVESVMSQVRKLLDQISLAVEFVLVFVLCAGVLVLWACVAATQSERRREAALLRALGASRYQLQRRLAAEMLAIGVCAGLFAVLMAEILSAVLFAQVLDSPPILHPVLWLAAPLGGGLLTGLAGILGARKVWTATPMDTLRQE